MGFLPVILMGAYHCSARALPHYRFALPKKSSCLRTLLWKKCCYVYVIQKLTSSWYVEPFPRYMWSKGRYSEPSWFGWAVNSRGGMRGQKKNFFHRLFIIIIFFPPPPLSPFGFWTTFTSVSPLCSTRPHCTPILNCVCPICQLLVGVCL